MQLLPEQIGRYQVLGLIGKGGMGIVIKGYDAILQRQVAIKILSPHLAQDETTVARFLSEARTAASLQHPNIITIHDLGREGDWLYIAMELLQGVELRDRMAHELLPLDEVLDIAGQVTAALA
ncbi:MAG: protein kinase domain-containing protein, partial [Armatimonadota bacterium]